MEHFDPMAWLPAAEAKIHHLPLDHPRRRDPLEVYLESTSSRKSNAMG
jgi:hypothetical protein